MNLLGELLFEPRDPNIVVAQGRAPAGSSPQLISWRDFHHDVARLAKRMGSAPDGAWVLLTEDTYAFAVGLFALWHTGRQALSPPNHQPESVRTLQTRSSGVLTDRPEWFPEGSSLNPLSRSEPGDPNLLQPLDRSQFAIEFYTSGTTGDGKVVTKTIGHLEDEVVELQRVWDARIKKATVFSTASHQHFYSFMIGFLWPLCSGRPFERQRYLHAAELIPPMRESGDSILASVPTHLRRFARHAQTAHLKGICRTVFSSGGPLDADSAYELADLLGTPPIELLGSTETGAIGFRTQEKGRSEDLWTPLPSVRVFRDTTSGTMRVVSPFVSVTSGEDGFSTGDRVEIRDNHQFVLLPRIDRIVKVGEKRLDLARMESDLRGLVWVQEVALAAVERDNELRVAAALVPSDEGRIFIADTNLPTLARAIRSRLADAWDPVLHPRIWRIVERLPENAQGKVTAKDLVALFAASDDEEVARDRPIVLKKRREADLTERSCIVPEDLVCLRGHFPHYPIVPAVLQLDWTLEAASELIETTFQLAGVPAMKMLRPLYPGQSFQIRVQRVAPETFHFQLRSEEKVLSKGRFEIEANGGAA